jgi:hypothetical protein
VQNHEQISNLEHAFNEMMFQAGNWKFMEIDLMSQNTGSQPQNSVSISVSFDCEKTGLSPAASSGAEGRCLEPEARTAPREI